LRDADAKRFFQKYGGATHGHSPPQLNPHTALTADATAAIVNHMDEAGLRRLELKDRTVLLILRDAAARPPDEAVTIVIKEKE
jgi:hypothetical protein